MCGIVGIVRFNGRPVQPGRDRRDGRQHPSPRSRRRRSAGRGRRRHRHAAPRDRRSQPARPSAALQRGRERRRGLQRRDLQPPRHPLAPRSRRPHLSRHQRHRDAGPRLRAARRGASCARASRGCLRSPSTIGARRRLFLARDGFGIKPLYIRRTARAALVRVGDPRAGLRRPGAAVRRSPRSRTRSCASDTCLRRQTAFAGIDKLEPGTVLEIDLDDRRDRVRARSTGSRPASIDDRSPDALVETAARAAECLGSPAPDGGRADRALPVGRPGFERADACSPITTPRRPRPSRSGFRPPIGATRRVFAAEVARRAGNENVRIDLGPANLGDLDPIVDALEEPLADSAVLPLWYLCRGTAAPREGRAVGRGRRRGARRIRPLFLGPDGRRPAADPVAARVPGLRRHRRCCRRARSASSTSPAARRSSPTRSRWRRRCALPVVVRHLQRGRTSGAGRRRATTAPPSATKRCSRPRASCSSIPCRPSSTSISRRCCSTTC